jgi:beta-glucosidase
MDTNSGQFLFQDPALPLDTRVKDLVSRLTLQEKIGQLVFNAPAIPRLNIPAYNYWSEALHGVARNGRATVFPQAIGLAATWNPALVRRVASAIGDEARAKYHEAVRRHGFSAHYQGLNVWSPNVNIFRDPRWGRGQETWGEDPFLTGEMGAAFVRGVQDGDPLQGSDHSKYLKAAACAKHYAVHSGPEKDRHHFNARVSERDLRETYLPAFKKLVTEAEVEAVMGAYNRTNGEPCCASQRLLSGILRGEWKFEGHVVSDCGALVDIHAHHHTTVDAPESAALAIKHGCDLECGSVFEQLGIAIQRGLVTEADIDCALTRVLATRFKLGLFDPPEGVPYASIPPSVINCPEHRALAYQAAVESIVLLKNKNNVLPIAPNVRSVFITGPHAADVNTLLGNYYGISDRLTTMLQGIISRVPEGVRVDYRPGSTLTQPSRNPLNYAESAAASCDLTIACMGTSPLMEGEEGEAILAEQTGDRVNIGLPKAQADFIKQIVAAGARVVLVLAGGSAIALGDIEDLVEAIVFVWYPGQEGGAAIADVLFGHANPAGRLPVTFVKSVEQLPPFDDYNMAGRTYRFMTEEPLYPFGYGLSYTHFEYANLRTEPQHTSMDGQVNVSLEVKNVGERAGDEVVQLYVRYPDSQVTRPIKELKGFQRITLQPGETRTVTFALATSQLAYYDQGKWVVEPGKMEVMLGSSSADIRLSGELQIDQGV